MKRTPAVIAGLSLALLVCVATIYSLVISNPILMSRINSPKPPPSPFLAFGPDCQITPVDPKHQFVAAAVIRGDTLTNVQINDPNSRTTLVRVFIENGSKPITVLLQAADGVVWEFEGATERVARAMIVPPIRDSAAVRGLPAGNVEFLKLLRCPSQRMPLGNLVERGADQVFHAYFGRVPEIKSFRENPNTISVPSLSFGSSLKDGPPRATETPAEKELLSNYPGGFRIVDAMSLVARGHVIVPEIYPGEAGLIQLERMGKIRPATEADADAFSEGISRKYRSKLSPDFRLRLDFSYVVLRDTTFPPGMINGYLNNVLVEAGVPTPRGNRGHGCLGFMDGFELSDDGRGCSGREKLDAIQTLKSLPPPEDVKQCRMFPVPQDAKIEAVSMYQPKSAKHSFGSVRSPAPISVHVARPGDVVLVLNTYERAIWKVSAADGARVVGVILTGYYSSRVEGVMADTPLLALEYERRKERPRSEDVCSPFLAYLGTSFDGGPASMVLDRQIETIAGKNIDGLRGGYALERVLIH